MERVGWIVDIEKFCVLGLLFGILDEIIEVSVCWLVKGGDGCWRRERGKSEKEGRVEGGRGNWFGL